MDHDFPPPDSSGWARRSVRTGETTRSLASRPTTSRTCSASYASRSTTSWTPRIRRCGPHSTPGGRWPSCGPPEVVANLLERLNDIDDSPDDWLLGDFAEAMRRVGEPAFEPLATYLHDPKHRDRRSWTVAEGIAAVGQAVAELRPRAIEVVETALRDWRHNTEEYNAGLVCGLLDLKATETMPLIREAMEAGSVDEFIVGTLGDVEYEFGLRDQPPRVQPFVPPGLPSPPESVLRANRTAHDRARARRKQAKASKKRNRRNRR